MKTFFPFSRNIFSGYSAVLFALAFPLAALADLNGTVTLQNATALSLDTGVTSSSGGDILFTGGLATGSISLEGVATAFVAGNVGLSGFNSTTLTEIQSSASAFSKNSINGASVPVGEMFFVHTNGGKYAKVLVTALATGSISLQYDTYGAVAVPFPTITAVLDAGSYTASIAQGSLFVVKGTNLSTAGFVQSSFPLPSSMGGVSISFAPSSGSPTLAYIDYLYNQGGVNQLAAVLPSGVAVGTYNVTVTNGSLTSAPALVQVVARKPGLITADSTGNGLAVLTQNDSQSPLTYDIIRFTTGSVGGFTIAPTHPGQTEVAYLVGSGADPGQDNQPSPGYNFLTNGVTASVIVGGTTIPALYLGRMAGGSGYEQINFTLPANVPTGCTVPFQVVENGIASQTTFISIAPSASATACVQSGYTTSQLQSFDNGTAVANVGSFDVLGASSGGAVIGGFAQYTGFELSAYTPPTTNQPGCSVVRIATNLSSLVSTGAFPVFLDAEKVTVSGPSGSGLNSAQLTETSNIYDLFIGGQGGTINGNVVAGTYSINGSGGTGIGPFSATVNFSPLTVTGGLPSTVNRGAGLALSWTGGNPSDTVEIAGAAYSEVNNVETGAEFLCFTTAGANGFTVPSSILSQLQAMSPGVANGVTSLSVLSNTSNSFFTAPLVAGGSITNATFQGIFSLGNSPIYQ